MPFKPMPTDLVEVYDPLINKWEKRADMPMFKFGFASVVVNNEIYTIGGVNRENRLSYISDVDVYNPTVDKWRKVESLTTPKEAMAAVVVKGTIYVLGGIEGVDGKFTTFKFTPIVEAYDTGFLSVDPKDKLLTHWGKLKKSQ